MEDQTIMSHPKISLGKNKMLLLLLTIPNVVVKVKMENNMVEIINGKCRLQEFRDEALSGKSLYGTM